MRTIAVPTAVHARRDRLRATVVAPGDPHWDAARRAWNLAVDQLPEFVALPERAEDVAEVMAAARHLGLRVAVQATGHGAASRAGSLEGTVLLNMSRMRGAAVDPGSRIARAEGGARWQDVVPLATAHGLTALHGSAPDVGVVGYTLGGGVGWLARRYGLAANAVTAIELVTTDGRVVRTDAGHEPELFWALRGGGGNFGVVTAIEFRLFPVDAVHAGWLVWPWERAGDVLRAWSDWAEAMPDEVTSIARLLQLPPLPGLPEWAAGRKLVVVEAAMLMDGDAADALLAPLRALGPEVDTFADMPAAALSQLHMDPPEPVPGLGGSAMLDTLLPAAVDALLEVAGPGSGSPLLSVELRHLGGALDRVPAGAGALSYLDGRFALLAVGIPMGPEVAAAIEERLASVTRTMGRWGYGRSYLNFSDRPTDTRTAFDPATHERLRRVRARFDAGEQLHPNHRIAPEGALA